MRIRCCNGCKNIFKEEEEEIYHDWGNLMLRREIYAEEGTGVGRYGEQIILEDDSPSG